MKIFNFLSKIAACKIGSQKFHSFLIMKICFEKMYIKALFSLTIKFRIYEV